MIEIRSETVEPRQIQLTIVVPPERIERAMTEAAQEIARYQRISGYRPGKVPLRVVVARVGEEPIREAAIERLTQQVVREALKKEKIEAWAPAEAEIVEQDPLTLRALVPLEPEVALADYGVLAIAPEAPKPVTDDDVTAVIEALRQNMANIESVDRPAEPSDTVALSLIGRAGDDIVYDEEALELDMTPDGAQAKGLPNEIVEALAGASPGDERAFVLRYSTFWPQPELRERDVNFTATVQDVLGRVLPPMDDDLAREAADLDTLEELRGRVRDQLEARAIVDSRDGYVRSLIDALVAASDVRYPPVALEQEIASEMAGLKRRVERQGFTWERWLELQGRDMEKLWQEIEPMAEAELRQRYTLVEFVRVEGIRVDPDEVSAEVERLQRPFSREARRTLPPEVELRRRTGSRLLSDRALDRLLEIAAAHRDRTDDENGAGGQPEGPRDEEPEGAVP